MVAPLPNYPIAYGTVNSSPIIGNCFPGSQDTKRFVTLSAAYARNPPPGYDYDPNPGAPVATSLTAFPQTIPSGARVLLFGDEAAALVAANAAVYS